MNYAYILPIVQIIAEQVENGKINQAGIAELKKYQLDPKEENWIKEEALKMAVVKQTKENSEMNKLIKCFYHDQLYYFHQWFQEGFFQPNSYSSETFQKGSIDIGAILEDETGQVNKVFDITEIKFEREEK